MQNVKIADTHVDRLRMIIYECKGKSHIRVSVDEAVGYLQSLERLAALERHLYNLTSDTVYKNHG